MELEDPKSGPSEEEMDKILEETIEEVPEKESPLRLINVKK